MPVKPGQSRNLGLTPHVAGAGPLVGPVLAAQMGYLPGTLWILAGVVFAGAVQDMTVLFLSTRRDGRSLSDMVRSEMGPVAGAIAGIGVLLICVIVLAVLALVVVKALIGSPWGTFTVFCTVPIALIMGVFARFSNRPFGVKRFQTIHHCSVDVARGLVLLFGFGTKALPPWESKTRWNNLYRGLAVNWRAGPSEHTNSPHPSSREGHHFTAGWSSSVLLS